jgi:hypothetical protein
MHGRSYERDRPTDCSACVRTEPIMHRVARESRPNASDALIVKPYAMSTSKARLAVSIGGDFMVLEESRIR